MEKLRPNGQRAKNAIIMIWVVLAVEVLQVVSGFFQYYLLLAVKNGGDITREAANANDNREQMIAILYLVAFIISIVTFIQWFRRAYFNLQQKSISTNHTEGWAAGCWFVPFINLYRPYRIMQELYEGTKHVITSEELDHKVRPMTTVVGWWWGAWIVNNLLGQIEFRIARSATSVDDLLSSTSFSIVSNSFGIVLSLITVKVIKDYAYLESFLVNHEETAPVTYDVEIIASPNDPEPIPVPGS